MKKDSKPTGTPPPAPAPRSDVRLGRRRGSEPVRCPYCHTDLTAADRGVIGCPSCRAEHHGRCWAESRACGACGATPAPPLERFQAIYAALNAERGWFEGAMPLRRSALTLVTTPGRPDELVTELRAIADELERRAGWFGELRSQLRFVIAALLLRGGITPAEFEADTEALRAGLREAKLRRGNIYEVIASLVLQLRSDHAPATVVPRFAEIYAMMKSYHWWLTGPDDFPACALLALSADSTQAIGQRVEWFYTALRQAGFSLGDKLQLVSHILYFNHREPQSIVASFAEIYAAFKQAGLWMGSSDYDEVALLTFLDEPPARIVEVVLAHREQMAKLKPKPARDATFSLACSTAFLELVRSSEQDLTDVMALVETQAIIAAEQAAAAAAAAGS